MRPRPCARPSSPATTPSLQLDDDARAAVEAVTQGLLGKLLHEPTVRLNQAAGTPRGERLADALRELFDL